LGDAQIVKGRPIAIETIHRTLTPNDARACIEFPFTVPRGTTELFITGWYQPTHTYDDKRARELAIAAIEQYAFFPEGDPATMPRQEIPEETLRRFLPIQNAPNYSLFDPKGTMRGQVNENGIVQGSQINEDTASPGCVAGPIVPGEWKMVLEIAAVVTNTMELRIDIDTRSTPTAPGSDALRVIEERQTLDRMPKVSEPRAVAVDEDVTVELIQQGRTVDRGPCNSAERVFEDTAEVSSWYTVKIYGNKGELLGLTNPIRIIVE